MEEWAEAHFKGVKDVGGATLSAHQRKARETMKKLGMAVPEELEADIEGPEFPDGLDLVWSAFCQLDRCRTCGTTPNPITYEAMAAWQIVRRRVLELWEVDLIFRLDNIRLRSLTDGPGNSKPQD